MIALLTWLQITAGICFSPHTAQRTSWVNLSRRDYFLSLHVWVFLWVQFFSHHLLENSVCVGGYFFCFCAVCVFTCVCVYSCGLFLSSTMRASLSLRRLFSSWSSRLLLWSTTVFSADLDDACRQKWIKTERRRKLKLYIACRICSLYLQFLTSV